MLKERTRKRCNSNRECILCDSSSIQELPRQPYHRPCLFVSRLCSQPTGRAGQALHSTRTSTNKLRTHTRKGLPCRNSPNVTSTTSKRTPPPGASRSTFGTKPLYSAAGPSSRMMVTRLHAFTSVSMDVSSQARMTYAGYVQLYLGTTPGAFVAPWMRDLTTYQTVRFPDV